MLEATRTANGGAGVLSLFGNYQGDKPNFSMAAEMAEMEDIGVCHLNGHGRGIHNPTVALPLLARMTRAAELGINDSVPHS
jgi:hypothetical protein